MTFKNSVVNSVVKIYIENSSSFFTSNDVYDFIEKTKSKLNNFSIKTISAKVNLNIITFNTKIETQEENVLFKYFDSDNNDMYETELEENVLLLDRIFKDELFYLENEKNVEVSKIIIIHCPKNLNKKLNKKLVFYLHLDNDVNFSAKTIKDIKEIKSLFKMLKNNRNEMIKSILISTDTICPDYLFIHDNILTNNTKIVGEFFIKMILDKNIILKDCLNIIKKTSEKYNQKIIRCVLYE